MRAPQDSWRGVVLAGRTCGFIALTQHGLEVSDSIRQDEGRLGRPVQPDAIVPADRPLDESRHVRKRGLHEQPAVEPNLVDREVPEIADAVNLSGRAILIRDWRAFARDAYLFRPQGDPHAIAGGNSIALPEHAQPPSGYARDCKAVACGCIDDSASDQMDLADEIGHPT